MGGSPQSRAASAAAFTWRVGLWGLAIAAACGGASPTPATGGEPYPVHIELVREGVDGRRVPTDELEPAFERAFEESPRFALADTNDSALSAQVWYHSAPANDGGRAVELSVRVEAPADLRRELGDDALEATVSLDRPRTEGQHEDVGVALGLALNVLEARLLLASGDDAALGRLLGSSDPALQVLAMEWVRDRRMTEHLDGCVQQLGAVESEVASMAVECVAAVGDERQVPVLLEHLRLADPGHTQRVYEALAELGGDKALDFLKFAARNEDDPDRRKTARDALVRLEAGGGVAAPRVARIRPAPRGHRR